MGSGYEALRFRVAVVVRSADPPWVVCAAEVTRKPD